MEERRDPEGANERDEEEDDLLKRFPTVPSLPQVPEAPEFKPQLPPHPSKPRPGAIEPGSYGKTAIAFTAASSFIMPIVVLSVGGYLLDKKLGHGTYWLAFIGVVVGLVAGTTALIGVVNRLSDEPPSRRR